MVELYIHTYIYIYTTTRPCTSIYVSSAQERAHLYLNYISGPQLQNELKTSIYVSSAKELRVLIPLYMIDVSSAKEQAQYLYICVSSAKERPHTSIYVSSAQERAQLLRPGLFRRNRRPQVQPQ